MGQGLGVLVLYQPAETLTHRRYRLRRARRQYLIGPPYVFAMDVPVGRRQDESGSGSFGINTRDNKPYVIADLVSDSLPESLEADVCVVGSGPVGITLALALSRRNARVILLESGGRKTEPVLQELYRSTNIG